MMNSFIILEKIILIFCFAQQQKIKIVIGLLILLDVTSMIQKFFFYWIKVQFLKPINSLDF